MAVKDWRQLYRDYKGLWVALKQDEVTVIAYAVTLRETVKKAKENGYERPIFTRVPKHDYAFTGTHAVKSHHTIQVHSD